MCSEMQHAHRISTYVQTMSASPFKRYCTLPGVGSWSYDTHNELKSLDHRQGLGPVHNIQSLSCRHSRCVVLPVTYGAHGLRANICIQSFDGGAQKLVKLCGCCSDLFTAATHQPQNTFYTWIRRSHDSSLATYNHRRRLLCPGP